MTAADTSGSLEAEFDDFIVTLELPDAIAREARFHLRRAFYAGALCFASFVKNGDREGAVERARLAYEEIGRFVKEVNEGRA